MNKAEIDRKKHALGVALGRLDERALEREVDPEFKDPVPRKSQFLGAYNLLDLLDYKIKFIQDLQSAQAIYEKLDQKLGSGIDRLIKAWVEMPLKTKGNRPLKDPSSPTEVSLNSDDKLWVRICIVLTSSGGLRRNFSFSEWKKTFTPEINGPLGDNRANAARSAKRLLIIDGESGNNETSPFRSGTHCRHFCVDGNVFTLFGQEEPPPLNLDAPRPSRSRANS